MALSEEQIEIALRVGRDVAQTMQLNEPDRFLEFASSLLAALPKPEPVAWATTNEDGDYAMLFFDKQEALTYSGDDEPIGLAPVSSSAHQPEQANYKAQRDAERYRWLRDQFWCEQEATFRLGLPDTESATIYNNALDAAIDASIAAAKGEV